MTMTVCVLYWGQKGIVNHVLTSPPSLKKRKKTIRRGGSRIFFWRGCTLLLLYFNTNKPHSFFFCIRKPQVISGGGEVRTPCTLPLDPPLIRTYYTAYYMMLVVSLWLFDLTTSISYWQSPAHNLPKYPQHGAYTQSVYKNEKSEDYSKAD